MSAEHTSRFLVPFLRWLKPDISAASIAQIHFIIRKAAHLAEYAILAVLLWRAFRFHRSIAPLRVWPEAIIALLVAFIFAATDEYHQSHVASRGASGRDVMIDGCGAVLGLTMRWAFGQRRGTESMNENAVHTA